MSATDLRTDQGPSVVGTDEDLQRRIKLLSGDTLRDDRMVVKGLAAAGVIPEPDGQLDEAMASRHILEAGPVAMQFWKLWYRCRLTLDQLPDDVWSLLCRCLRDAEFEESTALDLFTRRVEATDDRPLGVDPHGASPLDESGALEDWQLLSDVDRGVVLRECADRVDALEQLRFSTGVRILNNKDIVRLLDRCQRTEPAQWTLSELTVATLIWMWVRSSFVLQEFNQSLMAMPLIAEWFLRRIRDYERVLGIPPAELPRGPYELSNRLDRLRLQIQKGHLRCIQFDGSNWERREFLVPRSEVAAVQDIPTTLRHVIEKTVRTNLPEDDAAFWDQAVEAGLSSDATPTDIVKAFARWIANNDAFPVDYAIMTAPMGVKLEQPWTLNFDEVFCFVGFRLTFDPKDHGVAQDYVGIHNIVGQRMRYNVVKKAQNYTLVRKHSAQSFNLPDIAVAEDANHAGHYAGGIRLSCRVPTHITYRGLTWKGISDVRLNRVDYENDQPFARSDIPMAMRYARWLGLLADAAFARDLLFEERFCNKLPPEAVIDVAPALPLRL